MRRRGRGGSDSTDSVGVAGRGGLVLTFSPGGSQ
jgi:hypothetical protein